MWEDEYNQNGGRWIITLEKRVDSEEVNRLWLDTLLLLIEEQLSDPSTVCGVIFHNRWKFTKIGTKTEYFSSLKIQFYSRYFQILQLFGYQPLLHVKVFVVKFELSYDWPTRCHVRLKTIGDNLMLETIYLNFFVISNNWHYYKV